jgi:hypothetical protein
MMMIFRYDSFCMLLEAEWHFSAFCAELARVVQLVIMESYSNYSAAADLFLLYHDYRLLLIFISFIPQIFGLTS